MIGALVEAATSYHESAEVTFRAGVVVVVRVGGMIIVETKPATLDDAMRAAIDKLRSISTRVLAVRLEEP